ncbi:MAG: class I SAM-dependent methyltransferase [bacterium]|nr:class I SAM-dependent methyltransferase [bacterium]
MSHSSSDSIGFHSEKEFAEYVQSRQVDFIDFGCGAGQSLSQAPDIFGACTGIGCDIDPKKIEEARKSGFEAFNVDILKIPDQPIVRFVTMIHFLEHLQGYRQAEAMITKACRISTEFVFLRQPYFDADGELMARDLKCYWSDWTGHTFSVTTLNLYRIFRDLQQNGDCASFTIGLYDPIESSDHEAIHPLCSPVDQHAFDASRHAKKPESFSFDFPVYREVRVVASKSKELHAKNCGQVYWHHELFDSREIK